MTDDQEIDPAEAWKPYRPSAAQPWNFRRAAHFHRRTEFGATIDQIRRSADSDPAVAIELLFESTDATDQQETELAARLVTGGPDANQLSAWWLLKMVKSQQPFLEKMTLFWHGHFATGADKVLNARAMLRQNQLLREHALGSFESLVKGISADVAMLVYLDSEENRKTRPNENYARELLELFCLGPGNYTETDIKEIARCFTGWTIRRNQFHFDEHQHDSGRKSFFGQEGNFDGNDAIELVLKQPAAAEFIATKLIRYFVFDDLPIGPDLAAPVADVLRSTGFDIRAATRLILESNLFFSEMAIGNQIKSPVDLAIGLLRSLDGSTNLLQLTGKLADLGQLPLFPPNVKGWDGGRAWINASTILARANLVRNILTDSKTSFKAGSLQAWFDSACRDLESEGGWLHGLVQFLLATPLAPTTETELARLVTPDKASAITVLTTLATMPEFQLN